jgi:NAD dependent epimerase/dehydratase family enzyme
VMHRPALFPAPAFVLRLALGEMADALLLSSERVLPRAIEKLGYRFLHADLPSALSTVLMKI